MQRPGVEEEFLLIDPVPDVLISKPQACSHAGGRASLYPVPAYGADGRKVDVVRGIPPGSVEGVPYDLLGHARTSLFNAKDPYLAHWLLGRQLDIGAGAKCQRKTAHADVDVVVDRLVNETTVPGGDAAWFSPTNALHRGRR